MIELQLPGIAGGTRLRLFQETACAGRKCLDRGLPCRHNVIMYLTLVQGLYCAELS